MNAHAAIPWEEPRTRLARRLSVAAMFSLNPNGAAERPGATRAAIGVADELDVSLRTGCIALITGPSGAGKSAVLEGLARRLHARRAPLHVVAPPSSLLNERRAVIDLFNGPLHDDIRLLCTAGLAESPLWLRPARILSEGQRWRLSLALGVQAALGAPKGGTLIADEFASTLDRLSAMTICAGVNRLMRAHRSLRLVAATAHEDVIAWLNADVRLMVDAGFISNGRHRLELREGTE